MAQTGTATRIQKVATCLLPVKDQDRALAFYTGTLGFEVRTDVAYGNGDRWVEVAPRGGETTVALVPPMQDQAPASTAERTGPAPTHVSLYTEDIDADYQHLKSQGVDVDEQILRMPAPVPPMFWFRDVDGNNLLVVGPLG